MALKHSIFPFLNQPDSREALALFHQPYKLIAPALIRIEVLAAIAKRVSPLLLGFLVLRSSGGYSR
ncbi:hypothetical protein [Nostoc sp.]|uniref:hypothetical protein n=1 Tax=Nostoc sp. TaxID=1180 RepID=UPI002FF4E4B6